MLRSDERILTTHTGSLPRPEPLRQALADHERGGPVPEPEQVRDAVAGVIGDQLAARVDVINDGELGKIGYSTYVKERLTGFDGQTEAIPIHDFDEFPELAGRILGEAMADMTMPSCTGDVTYPSTVAVEQDIANITAATAGAAGAGAQEVFLTAASPGVIAVFLANRHYPTHEAYLAALAEAMKTEYDAIHAAGLVLQVDCPDLGMSRQMYEGEDPGLDAFRRRIAQNIEALNHAPRDIPPDRVRLHLCWGNYEGPHHLDVPLRDILDIVLTARASAISFEGANPRHEHEWRVFEDIPLPDDKIILPGVIDSTTNYIEHPELVAERIIRYATVVGRERVLASSDCGFATFATYLKIDPKVTWAKLASMAQGAELASRQLWWTPDSANEPVAAAVSSARGARRCTDRQREHTTLRPSPGPTTSQRGRHPRGAGHRGPSGVHLNATMTGPRSAPSPSRPASTPRWSTTGWAAKTRCSWPPCGSRSTPTRSSRGCWTVTPTSSPPASSTPS